MKARTNYVCQECGQGHSKWAGKCQECGAWNSLAEERIVPRSTPVMAKGSSPESIAEVASQIVTRIPSHIGELDTVLGGGLVPGSLVLLGGEPGIGKSTLLLQAAAFYAAHGSRVLYVSGEESTSQIALRAQRLGVAEKELYVVAETQLELVSEQVEALSPQLLIIDSIQTLGSTQFESHPGSVSQLRECTHQLLALAKQRNMATFVVGHVTKEGTIAGPKVLEHMVDVVLYFESTSSQMFRLLRSIKNRFGSTNELGVFEMTGKGVLSVTNPSEIFLSEQRTNIPGSVITATIEGTRPLLVEVQSLVASTPLAIPRRTSMGVDGNRVALLIAILEKRGGYRLFDQDIYVNVAGGLRLAEPASDLAVVAAILSSSANRAVEGGTMLVGEVGLAGEVRGIPRLELRLREADRVGLKRAFVPLKSLQELDWPRSSLEVVGVEHIQELADKL